MKVKDPRTHLDPEFEGLTGVYNAFICTDFNAKFEICLEHYALDQSYNGDFTDPEQIQDLILRFYEQEYFTDIVFGPWDSNSDFDNGTFPEYIPGPEGEMLALSAWGKAFDDDRIMLRRSIILGT